MNQEAHTTERRHHPDLSRSRRPSVPQAPWLALDRSRGVISRALTFPSAAALLSTAGAGCRSATLLARLEIGCVFMLRLHGHAWTLERIEIAGHAVTQAGETGTSRHSLEIALAAQLGVTSVESLDPALAGLDDRQWPVHQFSFALQTHRSSEPAGRTAQAVEAIRRGLGAEVRRINDLLDPMLVRLASDGNHLDVWTYNYLAHRDRGRFRSQFAQLYPLLLQTAVQAAPDSLESRLRIAVDLGLPVTDCLARLWNVRPATIRRLAGWPIARACKHWQADPAAFARTIDCIDPALLPRDQDAQWRSFDDAIRHAQSLATSNLWESPVASCWLRHRASLGWGRSNAARSNAQVGASLVGAIKRLRDGLACAMALEIGIKGAREMVPSADAVDCLLVGLSVRDLQRAAEKYGNALHKVRGVLTQEMAVVMGTALWPMLPRQWDCAEGARRARALTARHAFSEVADALENCLAQGDRFFELCFEATRFVVAFDDPATGVPCSAAEIRISYQRSGGWQPHVIQHRGRRNTIPSPRCNLALKEMLAWCKSREAQAHFRMGVELVAHRRRHGNDTTSAEALPLLRELRRIFGEGTYDNLLSEIAGDSAQGGVAIGDAR
jgi:hypothetical protein